jgi:DNA repair exonuclease SbcCD nuclease subunit
MKIFLVGDTHAGIYPLSGDKWKNIIKDYFFKFYIPMLRKKANKDDIVLFLGDLFDSRSQIPIDVLVFMQKILIEMSTICQVHIIIGNHDLWSKTESDINTPSLYKHIQNVHVYETPQVLTFGGKKCLLMPWIERKKDLISTLDTYTGCDYLFCHSDLNGARMHLKSVAHKNFDKVDIESFVGYKKVYSGHIHIVQKISHFTFVGSICEMDRNDIDNQKGMYILNMDDDTEEFIPNMLSPRFKRINILDIADIEQLTSLDTSKDFIDLRISNNLLIGNRKLRRKLEEVLQNGSFSDVEYIDDVVKETKELDNDFKITNIDKLEYEEVVKQYIESLKYDKNIMKGVLQELDDVMKIYNEQYKFKSEKKV